MKITLIISVAFFAVTSLFPPWEYTADRNGAYGFHSHKPAGYSLIFTPPANPENGNYFGVQIDFGRLSLEWIAIGAATIIAWLLGRNLKMSLRQGEVFKKILIPLAVVICATLGLLLLSNRSKLSKQSPDALSNGAQYRESKTPLDLKPVLDLIPVNGDAEQEATNKPRLLTDAEVSIVPDSTNRTTAVSDWAQGKTNTVPDLQK